MMTGKGLCSFALLLFALGVAGDTGGSIDAGDTGSGSHSCLFLFLSYAYLVPCNFANRRDNNDLKSSIDATYVKWIFTAFISAYP